MLRPCQPTHKCASQRAAAHTTAARLVDYVDIGVYKLGARYHLATSLRLTMRKRSSQRSIMLCWQMPKPRNSLDGIAERPHQKCDGKKYIHTHNIPSRTCMLTASSLRRPSMGCTKPQALEAEVMHLYVNFEVYSYAQSLKP